MKYIIKSNESINIGESLTKNINIKSKNIKIDVEEYIEYSK